MVEKDTELNLDQLDQVQGGVHAYPVSVFNDKDGERKRLADIVKEDLTASALGAGGKPPTPRKLDA